MSEEDKDKSEGAEKPGEVGMKTKYIGILAVGLIIGIIVGAFVFPQNQSFGTASGLAPEEAGGKVTDFINNNLMQPGTEVTLGEVRDERGLYNVTTSYMGNQIPVYITKDGEIIFLQGIGWVQIEEFEEMAEQRKEQEENQTQEQEQESKPETTIGDFTVSGDEICTEDGKPIIYFFGADWCGGCKWEHPIMVNVTSQFGEYISFHDNIDSTADGEIFAKYTDAYDHIPTLVLGCKYYRVGSGTSMGEDQEAKVLTALICNLTGNKPADVCTAPEIEQLTRNQNKL